METEIEKKPRPKVTRKGYGGGLYKQTVGSSVTWLFRYQFDGKERHLGLGSTRLFSLKEARKRATLAKAKVVDGRDPVAEKRAAKAERANQRLLDASRNMTFEAAAKEYYAQNVERWTNEKVRAQFPASMKTYVYPLIGKMRVADIQLADVLKVLQPVWSEKPETAGRVRRRIEDVLGWAAVRGFREGNNVAVWAGCLEHILPPLNRNHTNFKALPFTEVPDFWQQLAKRPGGPAAALSFTVLSAARGGEVRAMTWDEVDLDAKTWTVPAEKMKQGKEHVVPLSDEAIAIVKDQPRVSDYVFVGPAGKLSENALSQVLKRMGVDAHAHGFRSAFRDWCGERTSFSHEVVEFALAHGIPNKTVEAYRRYRSVDKRRKLMQAWAKFVTTPMKLSEKVVPLRQATAS